MLTSKVTKFNTPTKKVMKQVINIVRCEELEKEIDKQIFYAQTLTNNYSKVEKLRFELKKLKEGSI